MTGRQWLTVLQVDEIMLFFPRILASARVGRSRRILLSGVFTLLLIMAVHGALNASTGNNGNAEYLQWLLKNEEKEGNPNGEAGQNSSSASLRLSTITSRGGEVQRSASRVRVVIERIRR
ncbi:MAG: hypothetical protein HQM02_13695, partial [Magnetococcales bacterium]|nr:hypothetical protein [Magnetococcales bacterium]